MWETVCLMTHGSRKRPNIIVLIRSADPGSRRAGKQHRPNTNTHVSIQPKDHQTTSKLNMSSKHKNKSHDPLACPSANRHQPMGLELEGRLPWQYEVRSAVRPVNARQHSATAGEIRQSKVYTTCAVEQTSTEHASRSGCNTYGRSIGARA